LIGFNFLMQTFLGCIRLYDTSTLEIQTYTHEERLQLKIELEGRCLRYQTEHEKIQDRMNGSYIVISEPMLHTLREIACLVFRQMELYVKSGTTEKRETVLIEI
jgi:hypothetical protein